MAVFDVNNLKILSQRKFAKCLNVIHGEKHLVFDESLMRPLDRICGASFLRSQGASKLFKLGSYVPNPDDNVNIVFFIRSTVSNIRMIKSLYERDKLNEMHGYFLLVYPRMSEVCRTILEEEGLYDIVEWMNMPLDFLPLDLDLVSMEMPSIYRDFFINDDLCHISSIAAALNVVQGFFGVPHTIYSLGKFSKQVSEHLVLDTGESIVHDGDSDVDFFLLYDRNCDYMSSLISPLTFHGALDDCFGINCCYMELSDKVIKGDKAVTITLGPETEVFAQAKDLHFAQVSEFIRHKLVDLENIKKSKAGLKGIQDMKKFVSVDLKKFNADTNVLTNLLHAVDHVISSGKQDRVKQLQLEQDLIANCNYDRNDVSYVDDLICQQAPMVKSLRNMCLLSIAAGGVSRADHRFLKTHFLHSYGYEHMTTMECLDRIGLFRVSGDVQVPFSSWAKKFGCLGAAAQTSRLDKSTSPFYYTNESFCPLIYKVLELILRNSTLELEKFYGTQFASHQIESQSHRRTRRPKSIVVCAVGGLTYLECAVLRLFATVYDVRILIATTSMINRNNIFDQIINS